MNVIDFEKYNTENDKIFARMGDFINDRLAEAVGQYGCDLHNFIFNEDYAFIYTAEAEEACESVGTWSAIRLVMQYEKDNFGEVHTEIEPCKIANMVTYIYGEFMLAQIGALNNSTMWDRELTEEDLSIISAEIETWLENNLPIDGNYSKRCFDGQVWDYYGSY